MDHIMPNYLESNVAGNKYVRCNAIHVMNVLNGAKMITLSEEQVIILDDDIITKPSNQIVKELTPNNANTSFDVLNPEDNSVVSSMTYEEVYAVLYSLYLHSALERDAKEAAIAEQMAAAEAQWELDQAAAGANTIPEANTAL